MDWRECRTEEDFIDAVAHDCVKKLKKKDREYLIANPDPIDYHFSYGMYIRNNYIHGWDFSKTDFDPEPDELSGSILCRIFSLLIPDYGNPFMRNLYLRDKYRELIKEYMYINDGYPTELIESYKKRAETEAAFGDNDIIIWALGSLPNEGPDKPIKGEEGKKTYSELANELIDELADIVWREDYIRACAEGYGIPFGDIAEDVENLKQIFRTDKFFVPLDSCFLLHKEKIGKEDYIKYRRRLTEKIDEHYELIKILDRRYFKDRILARSALKRGWTLEYLPMYSDDESMVRWCLKNYGDSIEYAGERIRKDREWVKYAIEHSKKCIMAQECMEPYRKDKELVYLACRIDAGNYSWADENLRDDEELARLCLEQELSHRNIDSVYYSMSLRLRNNKELALLDIATGYPNTEYYSETLKDDDDIAEKLYERYGVRHWAWYYMSKRLQEKYKIPVDEI